MKFERVDMGGLVFYRPKWASQYDQLACVYTTRIGGFSTGPHRHLNLGYGVGDEEETVRRNRKTVEETLGFPVSQWRRVTQVHGSRVVEAETSGKGVKADGLVADRRNLLLLVLLADCVGVVIYDPCGEAVGVVHAGWRGSIAGISARLMEKMSWEKDAKPQNCWAAIGPSIGRCCYEVDQPVLEPLFRRWEFAAEVTEDLQEGKAHLDLKMLNYHILRMAGLRADRISVSSACTSCQQEEFYSYRRDGAQTGRMAAMVGLHS